MYLMPSKQNVPTPHREYGKQLNIMMRRYKLTKEDLAAKIDKTVAWIDLRLEAYYDVLFEDLEAATQPPLPWEHVWWGPFENIRILEVLETDGNFRWVRLGFECLGYTHHLEVGTYMAGCPHCRHCQPDFDWAIRNEIEQLMEEQC